MTAAISLLIGLALGSLCGWLAKSVQVIERRNARMEQLRREFQNGRDQTGGSNGTGTWIDFSSIESPRK